MFIDKDIIDKQRNALKCFMQERKLTPFTWAKKAGITEATIRHYLSGRSQSLTSLVLEKLARSAEATVNDLVGGDHSAINQNIDPEKALLNREIMISSLLDIEEFLAKSELKISPQEKAYISLAWYDLAQMLKQNGITNLPKKSLESLIRKIS